MVTTHLFVMDAIDTQSASARRRLARPSRVRDNTIYRSGAVELLLLLDPGRGDGAVVAIVGVDWVASPDANILAPLALTSAARAACVLADGGL